MPDRRKVTISFDPDDAEVLDALAHLAGYTGRAGSWIGDEVRKMIARKRGDEDVQRLVKAREQYQARRPDRIRHGLGVIDGGAAS